MQINDVTKLMTNLFPIAEAPKVKEITPRPEEGKNTQLSALQVGKEEKDKNYEKGKKKKKALEKSDENKQEASKEEGSIVDLIV
ncbi:MAG: hypothetical protein HZB79_05050 [Deltaproteobacteria bacterium]|nr:hypothetical protein [Deltaproteobacteria bacterium]